MTRREAIRLPEIADARAKLLALYRKARADNPALARLLFRRITMAQKDTAAAFERFLLND